jgi:hypothetical protein
VRKYQVLLDSQWEEILKDRATKSAAMVTVIHLIWLLQPLSHFSCEIGHVIFHAFELAVKYVEIAAFADSQGEVFVQQLLQPNLDQMQAIYDSISREKSSLTIMNPETLAFWRQKEPPTIGLILSLFELEADRSAE